MCAIGQAGIVRKGRAVQGTFAGVQPEAENDKLISALGYVFWFVPVIVLLTDLKESRFNKIHAYQGLVFFGVAVAYLIAYTCVSIAVTLVVPLLALVLWVGWFIPLAGALYLAFKTSTASQVEFPYLSQATLSLFKTI